MKDRFDDILKRKFDQHIFPVDENHRKDMIDLLDRQPKRRLLPFWWAGGIALLTVVAGLYFMLTPADDQTMLPATDTNHELKDDSKHPAMADNTTQSKIDLDAETTTGISASSTVSSEDMAPVEDIKQKATAANEKLTKTPVAETKYASPQELNNTAVSRNEFSKKQINTNAEPIPVSGEGITITSFDDENTSVFTKDPLPKSDESQNVIAINSLRTQVVATPIESLVIEPLSYTTGSTISNTEPANQKIKPFYVFGEAGYGVIFAAKPKHEAGWKLNAGAGIGYRLSPSVSLLFSGGYLFQNGGFSFQRESVVNQPGFGTRSSFNTLSPDKLHYVYSKLGARIRSHRHLISTHVGVQYLYGAQGNITTYVEDQFAQGTMEFSRYAWLKTNGLRDILWSADIAYGYQITPRWSVSAGAEYYFSSLTIEDPSLEAEGYTWRGNFTPLQPFIKINYLIHGGF